MDLKNKEYINKIKSLAKQKNAVIFAHYYTRPEIQEIADFIGDSLALATGYARTSGYISNVRCAFYGRDNENPLSG